MNSISDKFGEEVRAEAGNCVHSHCRHRYTNKNYVSSKAENMQKSIVSTPRKRRIQSAHESKNDADVPLCLFCTQKDKAGKKGNSKSAHKLIPVRTMQCRESILRFCTERGNTDRLSRDVRGKLEYMQDLCARDAVYHNICYSYFRNGQGIPSIFDTREPASKNVCTERPKNQRCLETFQCVLDYLDSADVQQVTVSELVQLMQSNLTSEDTAYTAKYMKQKLLDRYEDSIVIAEKMGTADVLTLKETASSILRDFYKQPRSTDAETQKKRIMKTDANLIRSDIKAMEGSNDTYPDIIAEEQISFLPEALRAFLAHVFKGKELSTKVAAVGKAIIQNTRPNTVLAPLQIELGVQMHKVFGSRCPSRYLEPSWLFSFVDRGQTV